MRVATTILTLFLASSTTRAFTGIAAPLCSQQQQQGAIISGGTRVFLASPLDGMNQEILSQKDDDDDDDVPMTKAEMRAAAKEMKDEMKRLKDEAAAAKKAAEAEE